MAGTINNRKDDLSTHQDAYFAGIEPCNFPRLGRENDGPNRPRSFKMELQSMSGLNKLNEKNPEVLPSVLWTAWALVLRCYTGLDDVCFGFLESRDAFMGIGAWYSNAWIAALPIVRLCCDERAELANLAEKARLDYVQVQSYAFKSIEVSKRRLFNTAILLQQNSAAGITEGEVTSHAIKDEEVSIRAEESGICLNFQTSNNDIDMFFHFWSGEMSREHALSIASTFDKMVADILYRPDTMIAELNYISDRDLQQVRMWNSTTLPNVNRCIHDIIHEQALAQPEAEAVCSEDISLSYSKLEELADRLAYYLVTQGVGPEVFVPLCFEKSVWNVVSMLAVLKAGGAFVALDHSAPKDRLKALSCNVNATIVLCSPNQQPHLSTVANNIIPIDAEIIGQLTPATRAYRLPTVKSSNAAYAIFTSGTTGEPKCTVIEHVAFCSGAQAHAPAMLINSKSRALQFAAHTFDASLVEIVTPLLVGGTVCIPSEKKRLDNITDVIRKLRVNWAVLTPSFVSFIDPIDVPGLETLVLAGEAMSEEHIMTWSHINLVNGYGPSEASVASVVNSIVTPNTVPTNIGNAVGVHVWVVDPDNHNRLVPVGCVGELLIQGNTLARGYKNDPVRTAEAFINDPAWGAEVGLGDGARLYKTGDLVRQYPDSSLTFAGRKDYQVKVHGQRVELGEIEHHLITNPNVKHGLVLLPKSGYFGKRLITVVSLKSGNATGQDLKLVEGNFTEVSQARQRLAEKLPAWMVPSIWLIVEAIPFLVSSKLDRKKVSRWVEEMSEVTYRRVIAGAEAEGSSEEVQNRVTTEAEDILRQIWSHVLNLSLDQVEANRSFLSLGGDSISAMQVMGHCTKRGIGLSVQEILRSKSIIQLAQYAKAVCQTSQEDEIIDQAFDLSPIQQLYYKLPNQGHGHFNQSFLLRATRKINSGDLRMAIETVIRRHSMLRARFAQRFDGKWEQRVTESVTKSYHLKFHTVKSREDATPAIAKSQARLNPINGPMFAVDLFDVTGGEQLLFMVGHHLVIDLVSWRIILEDVEELLLNPRKLSLEKPLPFQTWCRLQADHAQNFPLDKALPVSYIPAGDAAYWGMEDQLNTYGDVVVKGFEIDVAATSLMLTGCHDALHTELVDVLLSAMIYSFAQVFTDRLVPAIYTEGHGREPSGIAINLSRTVGWFTTMYPVYVSSTASNDAIETVRRVKDVRKAVPDNGRPYFASRCLTEKGQEEFSHHWPLELTFNYLGQYQQLEREGALLKSVDEMAGEARGSGGIADVGKNTPRFGFFEISAVIVHGKLRFSFTFNRHMKQQDRILKWIPKCQTALRTISQELARMPSQVTLSDFPLLSLTYERLDTIVKEKLPQVGVSNVAEVEDILPCSSMQEGLLISQTRNAAFYAVQVISEFKIPNNVSPDRQKLADAWQMVVNRHPALRTVFIDSVSKNDGLYDQIVLKNVESNIIQMDCSSDRFALRTLGERHSFSSNDHQGPPHRFTICRSSKGKVFCKLEISHAIMDGGSISVIYRDLALAYYGSLPRGSGFLYSNYVAYLQNLPVESALHHWKTYLAEVEPCNFPVLNDGIATEKQLRSLRLDFDDKRFRELQRFCDDKGLTFSNVVHTAWALTLGSYTDSEDVCFGFLKSERDAPLDGIDFAVGPFINMLVCRVKIPRTSRLVDIIEGVQKDYLDSLSHSHVSLAEVQHALKLSGAPLFNTSLSYRRLPMQRDNEEPAIIFQEAIPIHDPTEHNVSVNIEADDQHAVIDLDYWTDSMSDDHAASVADTFLQALHNLVHHSDQQVGHLSHVSERDHQRILAWNSNMPLAVDDCVHSLIEKQVKSHPNAPAICAWDGDFSFIELDEMSTQLAHYLVSLNIMTETLVPVCFDKSAYTIVAMMAILKAGAAAVPLDPRHPKSGLALRVRDTGSHVILVAPSRAMLFEDIVTHVVPVSEDFIDELPRIFSPLKVPVQPQNACFVIYTSGSTGEPKGVVLEHRAIATSSHATGTVYGLGTGSRVLQFASYTFDNSLAEIFFTLMRGGCVCVPSEHDRLNNLVEVINKLDVNFIDITPTVANFLQPLDIPNVKGLSLGGEPLTRENIDIWARAVSMHCCYGPSECSVNSTWNGDLMKSSESTNIGKGIGCVTWVVDPLDHNRLVPVGCVGELLIEGHILARHYHNDSEKTAKAFVKNPTWATGDNRRMYKTGDLCRYNSDGSLTYLGRKDTQVKLNGQRIELGEIEHHVKTNLPMEVQSAVELINRKGTKALAAFLCLQPEISVPTVNHDDFLLVMTASLRSTATDLELAIAGSLAAYMVPSLYIPVAEMPMTSSGKLDRRRLRTMAESLTEEQAAMYRLAHKSGREPTSEAEKILAELWESVLRLERGSVGAEDNFFRLGGDSIEAMRLIAAARSRGVALTVANIFQKPRLSDIAQEAILLSGDDSIPGPALSVEPFALVSKAASLEELIQEISYNCEVDIDSVQDIYPTTAIQEGLIALSAKSPGAYVAQNVYRLPTDINLDRFRAAWDKIVDAEVVLRTRIVYTKSMGLLQAVVREPIRWSTLTSLQGLVEETRQLPTHNGGELSRYIIVQEAEENYFVWTAHHALYDGWCIPLLLERVEACYYDLSSVNTSIGTAYPRFIQYLVEIDPAESNAFWESKLSGTTSLQFPPLPHPAYQIRATSLSVHKMKVARERGTHITLPSIIRAAWALTVATYSGSHDDVVFGETLTGRDAPVQDIADIIGPTLATVPTRIRIDHQFSIAKFLETVQAHSAEAVPFQYAGLQHIKHLSEDTATACGFQNLLAIHHENSKVSNSFWNLTSSGTVGSNFYSYPLTVSCQIGSGIVDVAAHYDQNVISTWLIEKILHQFEFILKQLNSSARNEQILSDLNLLNMRDQELILEWNRQPLKTVDKCIHDIIKEQVMLQPANKNAVESWDAILTYRELDQLSTTLAHHLITLGIQSKLVPLVFEKSAWTIVAMLAVLKSAAAFVPLDPAAPLSRLQDIVIDTEAKTILCSPKYENLCKSFTSQAIPVHQELISRLPSSNELIPVSPTDSAAYCIFTSGTTGKPKGTIVQHSAYCAGAASHGPALRMDSSSRVLQFASYTFDASCLEILTALSLGATVCVPSDEDRLNNITGIINSMNITWTLLTPSFIQLVQPSAVPSLHTLVLGGEAMSHSHISTWANKLQLINAYGPSECAVVATANPDMTLSTNPKNMGRAVGGHSWVIDPHNHNRLAPIGSVGELAIEGPILAKSYLKNEAKTADVFIENPGWAQAFGRFINLGRCRLYKTGDLVKYSEDGTMVFCGRKDTQVKLHGQRLELGEVEYHLRMDPSIQHVLATIPTTGFFKGRLVAILSLQELSTAKSPSSEFNVVLPEASSFHLVGIRERLCDHVPAYMVPSKWIVLQALPLLPSGKLDMRRIVGWVEKMDEATYRDISDIEYDESNMNASILEKQLQNIWGDVLNLPSEKIGLHQSFLHLGGDSISAMQVMSKCRTEDLYVTVQDIMQSKSISQLALRVTLPEKYDHEELEEINQVFGLSPIQKLYFQCVGDRWSHFNQSVMLRLTKKTHPDLMKAAIEKIVQAHSMLRARFIKSDSGSWQQFISPDTSRSYRLTTRDTTQDHINSIVTQSQSALDIQKGPILAIDIFNINDQDQIIAMVAHHLVVDVVSWRIILQDLENILTSGNYSIQRSLTFQTWSHLQEEHTQQLMAKNGFFPEHVSVADLSYWGMANEPNLASQTIDDSFELDAETTLMILGTCHESLRTDPVDVFIGSLLHSFRKVFSDRSAGLTIYNEGHGREPWVGSKIDLSSTVGWFTTMSPVCLPKDLEGSEDLLSTICWVKDFRNRVPDKGRPYFAYRMLTEEGSERFAGHWPMEMTFNYLGKLQQLERKEALLQPLDWAKNDESDVGSDVPRFALFEVSAAVTHGNLKMSFSYNKNMKYQPKIRRWLMECEQGLQSAASMLVRLKQGYTLSDYPLLPLSYNGVSKLMDKLPQIGISSLEDIEDVYPSSPMQRGMLLAQIKQPDLYTYALMFEAHGRRGNSVDSKLLAEAWQTVVRRHASLRTVFIESVCERGLMDQIVLKDVIPRIALLECEDAKVRYTLNKQKPVNFRDQQPPHRFTICKTDTGRIICKLEISHTICDGTSIPILCHDIAEAYATKLLICKEQVAFIGGTSQDSRADRTLGHELVEIHGRNRRLSITSNLLMGPLYSDYIAHIQSSSPKLDMNYWKSYLSGIESCSFPVLNDGTKVEKQLKSLILDLTASSHLRTFCTKNGVTLSNVLQLVWAIILRIYTGSDEVCFGYLTSGRDAPIRGLQTEAVGAFINMLTCRLDLSDKLELSQALKQVQDDYVHGMAHQSCSLADVQHELHLSGTSLFNTAFTFQKRESLLNTVEPAITFDVMEAQDPSEYDVTVNVEAGGSGVEVHFGYWTSAMSEAQADNMAKTFDHILNCIVTQYESHRTIGEIDLFSEHSRRQVLDWNETLPPKVNECIHNLIDAHKFGSSSSRLAVHAWDGDFTFTELEQITFRLAKHLVSLGVGPDVYVPLCFEKTKWAVVSMIAVMKSGGAFVPLDPTHPVSRLKHLVQDVNARIVLCSPQYQEKISGTCEVPLAINAGFIDKLQTGAVKLHSTATPQTAAYAIFTSGTTGLPKGTIIEHAAFCTSAVEHSKAMCMRSDSRVFQFASFTFDASVMEILTCLIVGGCVCMPSDQDRMNDISGAIRKMGVTWTLLTPSVANTLNPTSIPNLKVLVTGGEAMSPGHIERWKGKCLINAYGPSETSVIASISMKTDEEGNQINADATNIGRGIGARTWVVHPRNHNQLMPVGALGELVIEGATVSRGYLNNVEKTKAVFIDNPVWLQDVEPRERIYKTGDLVRYQSDGSLSFIQRKDTQIKLNGQRIELGEIEHHVKAALPDTTQATVDLVSPTSRLATKALAVFFTYRPDGTKDERIAELDEILLPMSESAQSIAKNLDASLGGVLPKYMIPSVYVPVIKLPWTSSGKLDRNRLRAIVQEIPQEVMPIYKLAGASQKRTPTTTTERKLQKLWESVLNITPTGSVSAEDNFFRLGGDSISAMKLITAARAERISLTVNNIFRKPKLSDMATICTELEDEGPSELKAFELLRGDQSIDHVIEELAGECRISNSFILDAYPCSQLQEGLVTLSIKQPGAYIGTNVFKLPVDVDINKFKAVWQKAVDDVDILRTRIVHMKSADFLQVVLHPYAIDWIACKSLEEVRHEELHLPAYNGGPLTRYIIVDEEGSADRYFIFQIHHALYDGWSLPMILNGVEKAYIEGTSTFSKASYASFIKYIQGVDLHASDEHWRSRLSGATPLQFPQKTRRLAQNAECQSEIITHTAQISGDSVSMDITIPTIIRAAWSMICSAYSGSNDVVFGETLAGRDIAVTGIADIIGPVLTTVPTRILVDRDLSVTQFLHQVHQQAIDVVPYQHAGLQNIKRLGEDTAVACDFQNLLVIQNVEEREDTAFWNLQNDGVEANFFTYPLVIECQAGSSAIDINAYFDERTISKWQVQRLLFQFDAILRQLSIAPKQTSNRKLSSIEVFSPQDRELVKIWNSRTPDFVDRCLHDMFLEVASVQPNAQAICAWDGELTYGELRDYALHLAHHLIELGVRAEDFVPISIDKSVWAPVAMLGIMMAGGVYVPFDPSAPRSRYIDMQQDINAKIILCSTHHSQKFTNMFDNVISIDENFMARVRSLGSLPRQLPRSVSPRNAAYCIFTSGSTGRPKGAVIEHCSIATQVIAISHSLLITPKSRTFQFSSFSFDVSVMEIFCPLGYLGGVVCIPSEEDRLRDVAGAINSLHATWAFLTPSVANVIEPSSIPNMKVLVCGGEAMSIENVTKWADNLTLCNGYGPTESTIIAVGNANVSLQKDPSNIGRAVHGGHAWIADSTDHNCIAPVGCVGELLLSGPMVAREYVNNPQKTSEVFIEEPAWATLFGGGVVMDGFLSQGSPTSPGRMYKTGDLARYAADGSIEYIGRKDNQVKLHGQRLELGEIEHTLDKNSLVQHALVSLPKTGPFKKRLVATISLVELAKTAISSSSCEVVKEGSRAVIARQQITKLRTYLIDKLPPYMVPSSWVVLEAIPLLASGKLDRRKVVDWMSDIDQTTYDKIMEAENEDEGSSIATGTAKLLQQIFSKVLNLPLQRVKLGQSFLSLGGDSITAMQVMAMCRKEKITFSMSEILRSKSIRQLAAGVRSEGDVIFDTEKIDQLFDLSPIQQFYFQFKASSEQKPGQQFNQSFSLRVAKHIEATDLKQAIDMIVAQHSMLRARFAKNSSGHWKQRVVDDVTSSYRYRALDIEIMADIPKLVNDTQNCLDIQKGPLFAVDLFHTPELGQMIFLAAHHLIIDMVSWRVILGDLEEILTTGSLTSDKGLSFQVWCALQAEHSQKLVSSKFNNAVLPFKVAPANIEYWGMKGRENTYSDVSREVFTINEEMTASAFGECNSALRTEPIDIFLAVIQHSFSRVFIDRETPTIFNENHGREPWDKSGIDLSRTVGWFTTISPLRADVQIDEDDVVDTVRRIKDIRRKIPDNGRPYFAQRFLTPEGRFQYTEHNGPMEIVFNYLGRMQQLEAKDSLLEQWNYTEDDDTTRLTSDVGPDASRFAFFEISAGVFRDKIQVSFLYNNKLQHQQGIRRWIKECQRTLEETIQRLLQLKDQLTFTLSDFPLLPISYDALHKMVHETLPEAGISPQLVESIYPCAPTQEGILLSQLRNPSLYHFHASFEVKPGKDGIPVSATKLVQAWQKVVHRHGGLRAIFVDSLYRGDTFNQIIIKEIDSGAIKLQCEDSKVMETLKSINLLDTAYQKKPKLPHQLTIAETSTGRVYIKIEINHAVMDGSSASILLNDLGEAYQDRLPEGSGPPYSDYVAYIKSLPPGSDVKFWKEYLLGVKECHFPTLNPDVPERHLGSLPINYDRFDQLQAMCKASNATLANVMQAAWAMCLRTYTKSEDVCFGYLTSGRDVPVDGVHTIMGAFINMLVCRVKFTPKSSLKEIFHKVQDDYLASLEYQHCSLAQVQHDMDVSAKGLFNTAVSIQANRPAAEREESTISFETIDAHDPSEFSVTLNINTIPGHEGALIRFWTNIISQDQAATLANCLIKALNSIMTEPETLIQEIDLLKNTKTTPQLIPEAGPAPIPLSPPANDATIMPVDSTQLRSIITECVGEVIGQLFKSGVLVAHNTQTVSNTVSIVEGQASRAMIDYSQVTRPLITRPPMSRRSTAERSFRQRPTISRGSSRQSLSLSVREQVQAFSDDFSKTRSLRVERKLLAVWATVLQIPEENIQCDDSFFQLGGDSIVAMQMVGIAREEGLPLTVANIFRHPIFTDMAEVVRLADEASAYQVDSEDIAYGKENAELQSQSLKNALYQRFSLLDEAGNVDAFLQENICAKVKTFRGGIIDVFPVTDFQALAITGTLMESKWMLNYFYLDGNGSLDIRRLKLSVYRLVDAFDILRTVFVPYGNRFFQVVLRKLQPSFQVEETDNLENFTAELQQRDRENGPRLGESYLQFTVAKQNHSDRHRIFLRISHAQYDGVCFPSILAALQSGYQSQPIAPTPAFSTYVRDAARRTTNNHYEYWSNLLEGSSMTDVVIRQGPNYSRATTQPTVLKRIVTLNSLSSENITHASIIKAAWSLVLARLTTKSDIVFGNVISGRNADVIGVESIVGPCVNMIPVRIKFQQAKTVLDLLRIVQDQQVANMPYESLGFREIIKNCTDWPDWTNFSTVCQHQNIQQEEHVKIGATNYKLGAVGSQEDFADLTVLSTPQGADEIEISLIFTSNSGITESYANSIFEQLCEISVAFSHSTTAPLPTPAELSILQRQTLDDKTTAASDYLSATISNLSKNELFVYSETLSRTWRKILGDKSGQGVMDLNSSFFELGGDIMATAQVASVLEQEGYKLRVEDLVDHPIMMEQIALLHKHVVASKENGSAQLTTQTLPPQQQEEEVVPKKKAYRRILGGPKGFARKMRLRSVRDVDEEAEG